MTLRSLLTGLRPYKKILILHGLELYGAGALLVHQGVLESRVRPLVSQEVVRQLDVDLLRTHNDHFVEKTNRHLKRGIFGQCHQK